MNVPVFILLLFIRTANAQVFIVKIEHFRHGFKGIFSYLATFQWRLLQTPLNSLRNLGVEL